MGTKSLLQAGGHGPGLIQSTDSILHQPCVRLSLAESILLLYGELSWVNQPFVWLTWVVLVVHSSDSVVLGISALGRLSLAEFGFPW